MPKDIFFEYCEFIFGVLLELERKVDLSDRNTMQKRAIGYVAERLTSAYLRYLTSCGHKLNELNAIFLQHTDIFTPICPAFSDNNHPIALACDHDTLAHASVFLASLCERINNSDNYDVCILHNNIDSNNINIIKHTYAKDNISLRFINMQYFCELYLDDFNHLDITDCFYFFIPMIFKNYQKIMYFDCKTLLLDNPKNFYNIDLNNNFIGAIKDDYVIYYLLKTNNELINYLNDVLKLKNPFNYFNANVMLFDIKKCNEIDFLQECIKAIRNIKTPQLTKQDILNKILENKVEFIEHKWNHNCNQILQDSQNEVVYHMPDDVYKAYFGNGAKISCLYYDSVTARHSVVHAQLWWDYARKSPYYEKLLSDFIFYRKYGAKQAALNSYEYQIGKKASNCKATKDALVIFLLIVIFKIRRELKRAVKKRQLPIENKLREFNDYEEGLKILNSKEYKLGKKTLKKPFKFLLYKLQNKEV